MARSGTHVAVTAWIKQKTGGAHIADICESRHVTAYRVAPGCHAELVEPLLWQRLPC